MNHNALSVQVQEPIQYVGLPPKLPAGIMPSKLSATDARQLATRRDELKGGPIG